MPVEISRCRRLVAVVSADSGFLAQRIGGPPCSTHLCHPIRTCSPLLIEFFLDYGFSFVLSKNSHVAKPRPIKNPFWH
jgi:hypothetical protein